MRLAMPSPMKPKHWLLVSLLTVGSVFMLLPFWVMLVLSVTSLKTVLQATAPILWPWPATLENYLENYALLFQTIPMGRYFVNSLLVSVTTTAVHVVIGAMAAYAFSRLEFPKKNAIFFVFLLTMMVPPQVNIVPLFFVMKTLHWINSYWALIVPGLFGAFGVFLLRQWFNGLPKELEEAATLDGCTPWHIFWKIALPLAKPPLVALAMLVFIGSWNSLMWPLVVTMTDELRTLPLGITALKQSFRDTVHWPLLMAGATVSVLPVVVLFALGQRYFMQGLMSSGLKE